MMIFVWGAIGFVFAGFAPGYLVVAAAGLKRHLPAIAGPFALSLIINNLLVELLVWGGLYSPAVMRPLASVVVLAAAAVLLFDHRLFARPAADGVAALKAWLGELKSRPTLEFVIELTVLLLTLLVVGYTLGLLNSALGSIIQGYDPVVQWNRWAVDWAHNQFPNRIYHYPQLVPVLWSIPYVLLGDSSIEFFSSPFKFIFWLLIFETLAFVSRRFKSSITLLSIPVTYALFAWVIRGTVFEDYIDVPVAFFSLLSVAVLLRPPAGPRDQKAIATALVLASGAAMTKQVGLYMLGAVPLLLVLWELDEKRQLLPAVRLGLDLAWKVAIAALLAAPMYIYAIWTIRNGTNISEFGYLFDGVFEGQSHVGRALAAAKRFAGSANASVILLFVVAFSAALWRDRQLRWLLVVVCVPFSLIWAFVFSYDDRNLALALPFWALTASLGVQTLVARREARPQTGSAVLAGRFPRQGLVAVLILAAAAGTAIAGLNHTKPRLVARQSYLELRDLGGEPIMTGAMLALTSNLANPHRILSEWRWACAFSFTRESGCVRIFPDQFFESDDMKALKNSSDDVLFILEGASLTPQRAEILRSAGFVQAAEVTGRLFFVRRRVP